jgi:hypothetical protein
MLLTFNPSQHDSKYAGPGVGFHRVLKQSMKNQYIFLWDQTEKVSSPCLRTETDPVPEMLCFLVSRIPDDGQSANPNNCQWMSVCAISIWTAWAVLAHWSALIVGSVPAQGMGVCVRLFCLCSSVWAVALRRAGPVGGVRMKCIQNKNLYLGN